MSYLDVFGIEPHASNDDLSVEDTVVTGHNNYPIFKVVALSDGKAWVKNINNGADGIVDVSRCRKIA